MRFNFDLPKPYGNNENRQLTKEIPSPSSPKEEIQWLPLCDKDHISNLPDDILVGILSTFKLKEAAQTSVLSHRWLNLWRRVPRLHFGYTKHQFLHYSHSHKEWKEARPVFVNWVNSVLQSHQTSNLQEFRISFDLDGSYQKQIDKWLQYAFDKRVQLLELNLSEKGRSTLSSKDSYNFSIQLLNQTTQCGVQLDAKVSFSCLKALYFKAINITGEAVEWLLLKCPLLEDLRLAGSSMMTNLVVSGPSLLLKHLEITSCGRANAITISNTNIVSLKVSTGVRKCLLLINLPKLIDVYVVMLGCDKNSLYSTFSCCLSQLTDLTLQSLESTDIMDLYKFPELPNLRRMVLIALLCSDTSMIGLTSLIDSCPRLEEFALRLLPAGDDTTLIPERTWQQKAMLESLKSLKVFELYGYHGITYESELIMFFIDNAVALEKIVIDPYSINDGYYLDEPNDDERTKDSRRHAIQKFQGVVPPHVELVIH